MAGTIGTKSNLNIISGGHNMTKTLTTRATYEQNRLIQSKGTVESNVHHFDLLVYSNGQKWTVMVSNGQ